MRRLISATLIAGSAGACASVEPAPPASATASADILPAEEVSAFLSEVETVSTRGDAAFVNLDVASVSVDSI
ncbi:MAG: hypothetical protein HXY23_01170 [Parvularculaceae bacterium]|nr:hypothetical protein [Parvularculaceae bacterium]